MLRIQSFTGLARILGTDREITFTQDTLNIQGVTQEEARQLLMQVEDDARTRPRRAVMTVVEEVTVRAVEEATPTVPAPPVVPAAPPPTQWTPPEPGGSAPPPAEPKTRAGRKPADKPATPPPASTPEPAKAAAPPATPAPANAPAPASNGAAATPADGWGLANPPGSDPDAKPAPPPPAPGSAEPDVTKLATMGKLREVLHYLVEDCGIVSSRAVLAYCESVKSKVPVLDRITSLEERLPRTLETLDLPMLVA